MRTSRARISSRYRSGVLRAMARTIIEPRPPPRHARYLRVRASRGSRPWRPRPQQLLPRRGRSRHHADRAPRSGTCSRISASSRNRTSWPALRRDMKKGTGSAGSLFFCMNGCTLPALVRAAAGAPKNARNYPKCGVQHSTLAVVGRKSGRPEKTNADNCTVIRIFYIVRQSGLRLSLSLRLSPDGSPRRRGSAMKRYPALPACSSSAA